MIYITVAKFPASKTLEVVKTAGSLPRLPPFIKKWRIYTTHNSKNKIKQYQVVVTDREKSDEALTHFYSRFMALADIEGYGWKIEACLNATDALQAAKIPAKDAEAAMSKI